MHHRTRVSLVLLALSAALFTVGPLAALAGAEDAFVTSIDRSAQVPAAQQDRQSSDDCVVGARVPAHSSTRAREPVCELETALERAGVPIRAARRVVADKVPSRNGDEANTGPRERHDVGSASAGGVTPIDSPVSGRGADAAARRSVTFDENGPRIAGLLSRSSLRLQPFPAIVVSVPPVDGLALAAAGWLTGGSVPTPQIADAGAHPARDLMGAPTPPSWPWVTFAGLAVVFLTLRNGKEPFAVRHWTQRR